MLRSRLGASDLQELAARVAAEVIYGCHGLLQELPFEMGDLLVLELREGAQVGDATFFAEVHQDLDPWNPTFITRQAGKKTAGSLRRDRPDETLRGITRVRWSSGTTAC